MAKETSRYLALLPVRPGDMIDDLAGGGTYFAYAANYCVEEGATFEVHLPYFRGFVEICNAKYDTFGGIPAYRGEAQPHVQTVYGRHIHGEPTSQSMHIFGPKAGNPASATRWLARLTDGNEGNLGVPVAGHGTQCCASYYAVEISRVAIPLFAGPMDRVPATNPPLIKELWVAVAEQFNSIRAAQNAINQSRSRTCGLLHEQAHRVALKVLRVPLRALKCVQPHNEILIQDATFNCFKILLPQLRQASEPPYNSPHALGLQPGKAIRIYGGEDVIDERPAVLVKELCNLIQVLAEREQLWVPCQ